MCRYMCVYNEVYCTLNRHIIISAFYIEMLVKKLDIYISAYRNYLCIRFSWPETREEENTSKGTTTKQKKN